MPIFITILLCIFTNLGLSVQGFHVPGSYGYLLAGAILLITNIKLPLKELARIFFIISGTIILTLLSQIQHGISQYFLNSTILLTASISSALVFYRYIITLEGTSINQTLGRCIPFVLLLSALETHTPIGTLFHKTSQLLYGDAYIYTDTVRDILLHGSVRPKLISQEPSHLAKLYSVILVGWYLTSQRKDRIVYFFGGITAGILIIKSPSLILALLLISFIKIPSQVRLKESTARTALTCIIAAILTTIIAVTGFLIFDINVENNRIAHILTLQDSSAIIRFAGPLLLAVELAKEGVLFGVGLGGKEIARETLISIYSQFDTINMTRFELNPNAGWGSAFLEIPIFYGIIGSCWFFFTFLSLAKQTSGLEKFKTLPLFALVFSFDAGFVSMRPWAYFFILMAFIHISKSTVSTTPNSNK